MQARPRSTAALAWLSGRPRALLPTVVLALVATAGVVRGVAGGLCLLAVASVVAWLSWLSWPVLDGRARAGRLVAGCLLLVLLAVTVAR